MHAPLRRFALTLITGFAVAAALPGCAGKIKSGTDFDQSAKFGEYTTYAWVTEDLVLLHPGTGNTNIRNEDNEKRVRAAVEERLNAAGMSKVDKAEASLIVTFQVGTRERLEVGGLSFTFGAPDPTYTEGTLSVDLFDPTGKHMWHGWASRSLRPGDDPDEVTGAAVSAIFADFPPK